MKITCTCWVLLTFSVAEKGNKTWCFPWLFGLNRFSIFAPSFTSESETISDSFFPFENGSKNINTFQIICGRFSGGENNPCPPCRGENVPYMKDVKMRAVVLSFSEEEVGMSNSNERGLQEVKWATWKALPGLDHDFGLHGGETWWNLIQTTNGRSKQMRNILVPVNREESVLRLLPEQRKSLPNKC